MIDGNVYDFIDKLSYEDHYIVFKGEKYFFNGCQSTIDDDGKIVSVRLEVYNLESSTTVFSTEQPTATECISEFENAKIWGGKSFWEAEKDMTWVDC